jgi:hypothetical protein
MTSIQTMLIVARKRLNSINPIPIILPVAVPLMIVLFRQIFPKSIFPNTYYEIFLILTVTFGLLPLFKLEISLIKKLLYSMIYIVIAGYIATNLLFVFIAIFIGDSL